MRRTSIKGFRVVKKNGKTIVEEIPGYGMNVSQKIAAKKKVRVGKRIP